MGPYGNTDYSGFTPRQIHGTEYGGVGETRNTLQPKSEDALDANDLLRLGYLTSNGASDPLQHTLASLEDRRQALGLLPAGETRPVWLANTGRTAEAEILGVEYPDDLTTFDPYIPGLEG